MISLNRFFNSQIRRVFAYLILVSIFIETIFSSYMLVNERTSVREGLSNELRVILKDPINQGSYIEAYSRLQQFLGINGISCISLNLNAEHFGSCPETKGTRSVKFAKNSFFTSDQVEVIVTSDDSDIWKRQLALFVVRFTYYLTALMLISVLLKKRILLVNAEIVAVKNDFATTKRSPFKIKEFGDLADTLTELAKKRKDAEDNALLAALARQLAHDIRSPITAVNIIASKIKSQQPDEGALLDSAAKQMNVIAEDLLRKHRDLTPQVSQHAAGPAAQDLVIQEEIFCYQVERAFREIIDQKQLEFSSASKVRVIFDFTPDDKRKFKGNISKLKTILSNLLNNSYQAISDAGFVSISTSSLEEPTFSIEIRDSGLGIEPEVLSQLGRTYVTSGKTNGNGIGLYDAFKSIESWGGSIKVYSKPKLGTTIKILLVQA